MEWVLRSPQIHSTFGNLGYAHADGYHVNENCNTALETILHNILTEDKYLRTYRRCISFGQNINKDLIPLLIHATDDKTIELLIRILVNLTIPVECLLSVDVIVKTDVGRHSIFEINNLLTSTKVAFTDNRPCKVVVDFIKKNVDLVDPKGKLTEEQCTNITNSLLLLRNILHIPEDNNNLNPNHNGPPHSAQNQILWNLFSQSIDKIVIKLMTIPDATNWGVTMVQLIALLYKDQHVVTLHKLLNLWLESSLSESSEDNESNTSPPDRGSEDSSPILTSDPTSDSSDTGGSGKITENQNSVNNCWEAASVNTVSENGNQPFQPPPPVVDKKPDLAEKSGCVDNDIDDPMKSENDKTSSYMDVQSESGQEQSNKSEKKNVISENSDCGYGTQIENQESISTSSNEDEIPAKKPVHQKPHNNKQRINKSRGGTGGGNALNPQERKRKKIVKRGKTNIVNVQGLSHKIPTDDDISNILKEFTVDFLLKGYNSLIRTLHNQILTNMQLEIDTSHFFWLVTYFLKFATQIELDLEHVCSVLSFDIVSYLTAEGVNLCEQFELAIKLDGNDLKPSIRRLHLVVTAIREIVQAIEVYKKCGHICDDDQQALLKLQIKMCETEELRSLLLLLLRHYNPKYHSKQYLQDLVVTNHILLIFLDNIMKLPDYKGMGDMVQHIKQFATPEIMYQYGLLLEDYESNGEFVNDCVFTLMHHVGGELGCLICLFQPKILKTFTTIWKSEFEVCDDWSDLIEYVINTFIKKPNALQSATTFRLATESFDDDQELPKSLAEQIEQIEKKGKGKPVINKSANVDIITASSDDRWTEDEISSLSWNFMQCNTQTDVVGEIIKLFMEDGITKSRESVINELFKQNLVTKEEFENLCKGENDKSSKTNQVNKDMRDDEISKLCEQLSQDGRFSSLDWVQSVLLETCFAKIVLEKNSRNIQKDQNKDETKLTFELFKSVSSDLPVMSPVSYHALNYNQSVPLVPWNCEQASICKDLKFLQLLHKLGFHMPVDTGKVFIRIPNFWTSDFLYDVAGKILDIDKLKLKFSVSDICDSSILQQSNYTWLPDLSKDEPMLPTPENYYQIHKQHHSATMVNFTPMPTSSFNSDSGEINKNNWLDMVQKSQECKRIMNLARNSILNKEGDKQTNDTDVLLPPLLTASISSSVPLVMPTVMSVKQEPLLFNVNISETDLKETDNHSVCETASVASDLTRMYVSDEDDKPEELVGPVLQAMKVLPLKPLINQHPCEPDNDIAEKRPRVEYFSPF